MKTFKRKCLECGRDFQTTKASKMFCSSEHYRQCKYCNKDTLQNRLPRLNTYCSLSCASKDRSYNLICDLCGKDFVSKKSSAKYCDRQHFKKCKACGNDFAFDKYSNDFVSTCSRICAAKITDYVARADKTREAFTKKYGEGITNASQIPYVKELKIKLARERYGVDNVSQATEVKAKRVETFFEKYGVENPGQIEEAKAKIRRTNIEKYGVGCVFQASEIKDRIKETMIDRYGVENGFLLPHAIENAKKTSSRISKINKEWKKALDEEFGVKFKLEVPFKMPDGKTGYADLGYGNVLIDINPVVTHNSTISFVHLTGRCTKENCTDERHAPMPLDSHQERFLAAEADGKLLLNFFEWYDVDIFISIIRAKINKDKNKVWARKCEVKEITQTVANKFLKENHLLGAARMQTFCVGVYYNGELVHVNTYGKPRLNKNYQWEAIRSCSKKNWHVQGGFSRADKFFFKQCDPDSVISYVDLAISIGETESANPGWRLKSTNNGSGTWIFLGSDDDLGSRPRFVKDAAARKQSADRILGMEIESKYPSHHPDGSVFTNEHVLLAENYVRMVDAGTRTFEWKREYVTA